MPCYTNYNGTVMCNECTAAEIRPKLLASEIVCIHKLQNNCVLKPEGESQFTFHT